MFDRVWKAPMKRVKPLSASLTKWSNTRKQFVSNSRWIVLNVFDLFVGLALKGLIQNTF